MYDEEEGVFIVLCDVESWYMFVVELDWGVGGRWYGSVLW